MNSSANRHNLGKLIRMIRHDFTGWIGRHMYVLILGHQQGMVAAAQYNMSGFSTLLPTVVREKDKLSTKNLPVKTVVAN